MQSTTVEPTDNQPEEPSSASRPQPRWKIALLFASSAALSGIAVVLWNRRSLQQLRQPVPPSEEAKPQVSALDDEFI